MDPTSQLDRVEKKVDKIHAYLAGNGDPSKGLIVRVDRLEGKQRFRGFVEKTALGAVVVGTIGMLLSWLRFRPPGF